MLCHIILKNSIRRNTMHVTAVIPAYNEEQTIAGVVNCVKGIEFKSNSGK